METIPKAMLLKEWERLEIEVVDGVVRFCNCGGLGALLVAVVEQIFMETTTGECGE
uniref:Uncharacterized protein n=1 Tax=Cucumis melo TaxID=3656 RepID=A0A9I9CF09_CUCME